MQDIVYFINHNIMLTCAWLLVVFLLVAIELRTKIYGAKKLSTAELVQWLNGRDALLYDLRAPADFSKGHISQAINYFFTDINNLDLLLNKISKASSNSEKPVILICKDGSKSSQEGFNLKNKLKDKGIKEVGYLQGGMMTWQSESLPTVNN